MRYNISVVKIALHVEEISVVSQRSLVDVYVAGGSDGVAARWRQGISRDASAWAATALRSLKVGLLLLCTACAPAQFAGDARLASLFETRRLGTSIVAVAAKPTFLCPDTLATNQHAHIKRDAPREYKAALVSRIAPRTWRAAPRSAKAGRRRTHCTASRSRGARCTPARLPRPSRTATRRS